MASHNNPTEPRLKLPPLSCDAHFHILGPKARFPFDQKSRPPMSTITLVGRRRAWAMAWASRRQWSVPMAPL